LRDYIIENYKNNYLYNLIPALIQPFHSFSPLCFIVTRHMKKILFLVIVFTFCKAGTSVAQSKEDVIYLNNGSILRGKVTENVPGNHTTIEIAGRNVFVIPDTAVKIILMDQMIQSKDRENKASPVEMAASAVFYGGSKNSGGFTFITSYRFPFRLSTGFGLGIEWFDHQQIPFIADFKYSFLKGSWSPYVYAQGGYAVPLTKSPDGDYAEYYGGPMAGVGGGVRFNFTNHNALIFSMGYRYQKTKTVFGTYPWYSSYQQYETIKYDEFNRLTFSFGFVFN